MIQANATGPATFDHPLSEAPLSDLVDHVIAVHHAALRRQIPVLKAALAEAVADAGEADRHLREIAQVFTRFAAAIDTHIRREEQVTFPLIRQLDFAMRKGWSYCGGLDTGLRELLAEHTEAHHALQLIRDLTDHYAVPLGAPDSLRRLYRGLEELDDALHQHMDLEEHVLFSRAATTESDLCSTATALNRR